MLLPLLLLALRRWLSSPSLSDFSISSRSPSALFRSFLLTMSCSGIYHKLSFLRLDGGCGAQNLSSEGEKNVAFSYSFELVKFVGKFTRISALVLQSLLEICPQISWRRDFAAEEFWFVFYSAMDLVFSRMFAWRNAAFVNRSRRIGSNTLLLFLEVVVECGGSVSCDTQPNYSYCTFVTTLLWPFVWLFFNLPVQEWALSAELTSRFRFIELTFGRMPILTRRFGASTFQEVFTRLSIEFIRLASASGISFSRHASTLCFWRLWLRGWFGFRCRFWCTIVTLMPETASVSLRTLAFLFPLVTNIISSFNTA